MPEPAHNKVFQLFYKHTNKNINKYIKQQQTKKQQTRRTNRIDLIEFPQLPAHQKTHKYKSKVL